MSEGVGRKTILAILTEVGTDISKWHNVKHFCSWLGLCPANKQ
ncbi:MAG: transposase [Deltaproteobacteria bacterium]|nr:transposase [Deltaproteobacteria bacterium]